jgi:RimJ/RimL family protein N-acetyltransferase
MRLRRRLGQTARMAEPGMTDGVVALRAWDEADAGWYAEASRDAEIQRFTTESPTLTADEVRAAIRALPGQVDAVGFVACDAATGERLGNVALRHEGSIGEVSYWVAAPARGRGVATRALRLVSAWALAELALSEIRLWTHAGNAASRRVAERAGYRRAPDQDRRRTVKGAVWDTVGYRLLPGVG